MRETSLGILLVFARAFALLSAFVLALALLVRLVKPIAADEAGFFAALIFLAFSAATLGEAFRRGALVATIRTSTLIGFVVLNYAAVRYGVFSGL